MHARTTLVEMVPHGNRFFVRLLLGGAAVIALLEGLYVGMPRLASRTTDGRVAALDLDGEGSLAVWVSSFTLVAAAAATLVVHVLQSDRSQARRRLWLWAAACWTAMSLDECASLHEAFKELMSHATGERLIHDGTIWWVGAYFLVLSVTGLRLLWEMRSLTSACLAFLAVAACYGVAVGCELRLLTAKDRTGVMVEEGAEMLGNFCLLTAMLLYARHLATTRRACDREEIYSFIARDDTTPFRRSSSERSAVASRT